ncbi:MAG TPA: peptide deformylase [Deltaproteobacteria bacterium]|nr:peptide deformylase [Deltaproteobacteria bacterium]
MAVLYPIRKYPDSILRQKASPIEEITDEVRKLAADMIETMQAASGVGLAANQVGVALRLIIVDMGGEQGPHIIAVINPQIVESAGEETAEEGCLSVPGFYEPVKRALHVTVKGIDLDGSEQTVKCTGLAARAFQHEIDHLDGTLFIDHLSPLKRQLFRKEYLKQSK